MKSFGLIVGAAAVLVAGCALGSDAARATADGCAVVTPTPDGFLSVRSGPHVSFKEFMRLAPHQYIVIDDRRGDTAGRWWHVTGLLDRDRSGRLVFSRPIEGWAHSSYLRDIPCD